MDASSSMPKLPEDPSRRVRKGLKEFLSALPDFFSELLNLRDGLDSEGTIISIKNNKRMQGANAWLLMCSIMVASLGLDLNSPAIIIGAMLISPLMAPILGIGLSIGINDRNMLSISLKNILIAIAIALLTSYLYFKLTPLGRLTSEIEARTAPTFLDVMVAFFGGIAGIISISRREPSSALPGVAIATALMPPLCVTGFGLAKGQWDIALNSFYLFFLNTAFVALATYLIVRYLKFPFKEFQDLAEKRRTQWIILLFSLVIILPSVYILTKVLDKINRESRIEAYMKERYPKAFWEIAELKQSDSLEVKLFLFESLPEDSLQTLRQDFDALQLKAKIRPIPTHLPKGEFEQLHASIKNEMLQLLDARQQMKALEASREDSLLQLIDSLQSEQTLFLHLQKELPVLFPDLEEISFARMETSNFKESTELPTFLVRWHNTLSARRKKDEAQKLYRFVQVRAGLDTLKLLETK